ncbi:MAG: leucine-rich repeat protein [Lachnospiraceae bacterium]|nr:leucine-rich repeat protein [Lachnospiraceae bacterium]
MANKKGMKRRVKKQVRKTFGALFMVAAILVAMIPTRSIEGGNVQAANACTGVIRPEYYITQNTGSVTDKTPLSEIPVIEAGSTIYTTGDQTFYFAYINSMGIDEIGNASKFAIITGYNPSGAVDANGTLEIPQYVRSFRKISDVEGYCLTNVCNQFLFYKDSFIFITNDITIPAGQINPFEPYVGTYVPGDATIFGVIQGYVPDQYRSNPGYYTTAKPDEIGVFLNSETPNYDENGTLISTTYTYKIENNKYSPCTATTEAAWKDFPKDSLYYRTEVGGVYTYTVCSNPENQYVDNIPVKYIANQFSVYDTATSTYVLSPDPIDDAHPTNGVFADTKGGNIRNLIIPESMEGIGDYAFYNCTALSSVTLSNQLVALGNHCFDGCRVLTAVNMDKNPRLNTIGAYAFANCPQLASFYIPHNIAMICDGVFENDTSLTRIDLTGDISEDPSGSGSNLTKIGNHVFYGCTALREVIFGTALGTGYSRTNPREISINIFEDCPNLAKITVLSPYVTFVDDAHAASAPYPACNFSMDDFHDLLVSDEFCFEGVDPAGAIRPNEGIGVLHSTCQNMSAGHEFTFKYYGEELYEKTITEEGGGKAIYQVDSTNSLVGFTTVEDATHTVRSLSFPEHFGPYYINEIPAEKFRDKKNLKTVRLPSTINIIGDRAFQGCDQLQYVYFENDNVQIGTNAFLTQGAKTDPCPTAVGSAPANQLYFVTSISEDSNPFRYAMSDGGRFSHENQIQTWPIIYSGFPTLLEVQYNPDKKCAELTNFPTAASLGTYYDPTDPNVGWYLTQEEKDAIDHYLANPGNPTTNFDRALQDVCETLTIPRGVKSIKDGLFAGNTDSANRIAVVSEGLTELDVYYEDHAGYEEVVINSVTGTINTTFTNIVDVDPSKGDFAGCPGLTSITFQGNETITIPDYAFYGCNSLGEVSVHQQVESIGEQAFSECNNLTTVELMGVREIKDHAFLGDDALSDVTISADTSTLGRAPFRLCPVLSNVKFGDNPYYTTANGIIYGLDSSGNRYSLVEFLAGRSSKTLQTADATEINGIAEEAFADTGIQIVNLESSHITSVPEYSFDNCDSLVSVYLPDGCELIRNYAFRGSSLSNLTVNDSDLDWQSNGLDLIQTTYDFGAGIDHGASENSNPQLTVFAPAETDENGNVTNPSRSYERFRNHKYIVEALVPVVHYYVTYWDYASADATKRTVRTTEEYNDGDTVTVLDPLRAVSEGFKFSYYENRDDTDETYGYRDQFVIHSDLVLQAVYEGIQEQTYTATFMDTDPSTGANGNVLVSGIPVESKTDSAGNTVYYINASLISGIAPTQSGYTFSSWTPFDPRNNYEFVISDANISSSDPSVIVFRAFYQNGENGGSSGNGGLDAGYYWANYYMPDGTTLYRSVGVKAGTAAFNLAIPDGYTGYEWSPKPSETIVNSTEKFVLVPAEGTDPSASNKYTATYYYTDGVSVYQTLEIEAGGNPPSLMMPEGYKHCMWSPDPSSITMDKNMRFTMVENPNYVAPDNDENYTGPFYTLTVVNGSGSGSYSPGAQVVIVADEASTGTMFSSWTVTPGNTPIATKALSATVVTMPSENVTVTANYVVKPAGNGNNGAGGTGSGAGNGGGNGNNYWPSTGNVPRSSGTTVVIDKNGLSNTGVVSATVNGSTDNFTIKITESQTANRLVLDALLKKYGNVNNIIYFPFDISLYDASGTTQITDTSGLTITITIPIPDSMIQYAANNKVAVITNNEIDPLNAKFTTINGVPCVTFTCTHFSPYVIYVNTVEMTAGGDGSGYGTGLDDTPKTADPIHPKWFISIALFAISIVLFLMKDKRTLKPVKADNGRKK